MQADPVPPTVKTFRCLEGLRGYMAWCVVLSHAMGATNTIRYLPQLLWPLFRGRKAVNEFIILSGFVIAHLILSKAEPYRAYITRRAFRIVPIYAVCMLLAAAVPAWRYALSVVLGESPDMTEASSVAAHLWQHVALHATLLHGVVPDTLLPFSSEAILAPAWSLSLEWQFYLVAPLLLWLLRKSMASQGLTIGLLLAAYFLFSSGSLGEWQHPSMLFLSIHWFLIGILSRLWLDASGKLHFWAGPVLLVVAACLLRSLRWELLIWAFFHAAVLSERSPGALPAVIKRPLAWVTANPMITALGRVSYSTYLVHLPVFSIVLSLGLWYGASGQRAAVALLGVAAVLIVPISFLLYSMIERRFIRIGGRFNLASPTVTPVRIPDPSG